MAISFVASVENYNDGSVSSLACSTTLNVAAGDFLVGWITWEDSASTLTSVTDGVSNSLTMEATTRSGNGTSSHACFGVKLTATAAATATFTATWSGNVSYPRIIVLQFRPDASETQTVDQKNTATGNGNTSPYTSGAITTTGTDEVVIGAIKHWMAQSWTGAQIGDAAVDGFIQIAETNGPAAIGYKNTTGTVHADFTKSSGESSYWVCNIISIKSEAAGGGATATISETLNFAESLD